MVPGNSARVPAADGVGLRLFFLASCLSTQFYFPGKRYAVSEDQPDSGRVLSVAVHWHHGLLLVVRRPPRAGGQGSDQRQQRRMARGPDQD